jgi:hypothetical protein
MAEQEVIKHTKKVFKIWGNKNVSIWHKVREFILEIAIIVFAISLSIWVHDKSEHSHQQKEVKEFLLGLREDLQADVAEMKEDKESYVMQGKTFSYITSLNPGKSLNNDSLKKYQTWLFNITRLQENNGRFEGFKAAGKIGAIEDLVIQNNIMDLYQENIPAVLASTDAYIRWKNKLLDFNAKNRKRTSDSTNNIPVMLLMDEAQNLCGFMANPSEIIERYDSCISKMNSLLKEIGDRYGLDEHQ